VTSARRSWRAKVSKGNRTHYGLAAAKPPFVRGWKGGSAAALPPRLRSLPLPGRVRGAAPTLGLRPHPPRTSTARPNSGQSAWHRTLRLYPREVKDRAAALASGVLDSRGCRLRDRRHTDRPRKQTAPPPDRQGRCCAGWLAGRPIPVVRLGVAQSASRPARRSARSRSEHGTACWPTRRARTAPTMSPVGVRR